MARGTIAKVVRDRGFGFIRGNDGKEVYFHRSGLIGMNFDELEQGTLVDFEVEKGPKGLRAANVRTANRRWRHSRTGRAIFPGVSRSGSDQWIISRRVQSL